jgi:oligopeptide transport system substrate-binding protein
MLRKEGDHMRIARWRRRSTWLAVLMLLAMALTDLGAGNKTTGYAQIGSRTFPQTGKTVRGKFLQYWNTHGALAQQGYPISEEMQEKSDTDGKVYTVQYFERAVFELHPENRPPHDVLLSLLGVFQYRQKYPGGAAGQVPNKERGSVFMKETGKRIGPFFYKYWRTHGGLAQQGYPISDEFVEISDLNGRPYLVQYFERAVFEYHPENRSPNDVLLSQLGTFQYKRKYASSGTPARVFRWPSYFEPYTLDPALISNDLEANVAQNLYDGLAQVNPQTQMVEPAIAERWEVNADATVYTFHLRKDVKFTNGDAVTAADFKYSWNRLLKEPDAGYRYVTEDIKGAKEVWDGKAAAASGIEAPDPHTFRVTLVRPSAHFLSATSMWIFYVVNKKVLDRNPDLTVPRQHFGVGTGAYTLHDWEPDSLIRLKVNPDYWGQKAAVDVDIPILETAYEAYALYQNGQLDVIEDIYYEDLEELQRDPRLKSELRNAPWAWTIYLSLNVTKAPLGPLTEEKARKVRQALAMSIDRQKLIDEVSDPAIARPLTTLLPKGEPGYHEFNAHPFNPTRARQLLADAGYPNGQGLTGLTYVYRDLGGSEAFARAVEAQIKSNVGVSIQVLGYDATDYDKVHLARDYAIIRGGWIRDHPDPQNWIEPMFHSRMIQRNQLDASNDSGYSNPRLDSLLDQANALAGPAQQKDRIALYQQAEELVLTDAAVIPLYQPVRNWLASPRWTGYGTDSSVASLTVTPFRIIKPAR